MVSIFLYVIGAILLFMVVSLAIVIRWRLPIATEDDTPPPPQQGWPGVSTQGTPQGIDKATRIAATRIAVR